MSQPSTALRAPLIVTLLLLPLVYIVTWLVLTGKFSPEVQSMVVGNVMGAVLGSLAQYWLGSSAGSARKDERAAAAAQAPPPAEQP